MKIIRLESLLLLKLLYHLSWWYLYICSVTVGLYNTWPILDK